MPRNRFQEAVDDYTRALKIDLEAPSQYYRKRAEAYQHRPARRKLWCRNDLPRGRVYAFIIDRLLRWRSPRLRQRAGSRQRHVSSAEF